MADTLAIFGGAKIRSRPFPAWPVFDEAEEQRLLSTLHSGKWGRFDGTQVAEFERRFAALHGCRHGIAVVNGTVSLRVALMAAGVQAGDEVIVPAYTFLSTATAVLEANAVPVFVDIEMATFNMDPQATEAAITPRTRAIIPVHFAGQPVDMDFFSAMARKHGLTIIEDAAHAHGATFACRPVGSLGNAGSFSFQSSKNMTCGEGGIIVTNDDAIAEACWAIHNCGRKSGGQWYEHHVMCGNYRLTEFQAAVLNAQLDRLEEQMRIRDSNGRYLAEQLAQIPGIYPQRGSLECTRHAYHLFAFRIHPSEFGASRTAVIRALRAEGIPVSAGYPVPLYRQPLFLNRAFGPYAPTCKDRLDYSRVFCPAAETICTSQGAWLEHRLLLGTRDDVDDIIRAFTKVYEHRHELGRLLT